MPSTVRCAVAGFAVTLAAAPSAAASVAHTVQPGETLWSIAAANGFTTRSFAAANGLPADANVVVGQTIDVPSEYEAAVALGTAATTSSTAPAATTAPATTTGPSAATGSMAAAPGPAGAYSVQYGDTLWGIASRSGISVSQLAWMNGLDPTGLLVAGTPLKLPTGSPATAPASSAAPAVSPPAAAVPPVPPQPTPERVAPSAVSSAAATHGVPASLAAAIAHQESGFNNNVVSSAGARGVMQIMPGTWDYIQRQLAGGRLNPASASDNVNAGAMFLGQLLRDTGGDPAAAAAAYYQGLSSVRRIGMLPETRRYVANVMALRQRYGGP